MPPCENKKEYQVLILGTSRTFEGIHPAYIRDEFGIRAFKEAFVGKGPMYNYFFYQEYKKHMGIPRVVIYGVDYFQFNITSERRWMKRFPADLVDAGYFKGGVSLLLANKPRIDEFSNALLNNLKEKHGQRSELPHRKRPDPHGKLPRRGQPGHDRRRGAGALPQGRVFPASPARKGNILSACWGSWSATASACCWSACPSISEPI